MILLQKLDPAENIAEHCNFSAGICHTSCCCSRLTNIRVEDVLEALEHVIIQPPETIQTTHHVNFLEPVAL